VLEWQEFDMIQSTALARAGWCVVGSGSEFESICIVPLVSASFDELFVVCADELRSGGVAVAADGVAAGDDGRRGVGEDGAEASCDDGCCDGE
jgi:hypothetical protein